jgi:glycosyltransferase involved in cell wall biosynthesis
MATDSLAQKSDIKPPHVSVVIPVYNEEAYLPQCLDSLFAQTITADAIYVIDNNSTDKSMAIAKKYTSVTILKQTVQGISATTKAGLDAAAKNGGILLRCDADSRPTQDWIEQVLALFERHSGCIAVTGPGVSYDVGAVRRTLIDYLYMKPYFLLVGSALGSKPLFGSNFAIKADAWKSIAEDTHLHIQQNIHDDIDLSYHLKNVGAVHFDKNLKMPISARPFKDVRTLPARYTAGMRSVLLHWPEQSPWRLREKR